MRGRDGRRRSADAPPPGDPRPHDAGAARGRPRARRADRGALGLRGDDLRPLRLRPRRPGRDDPGLARARGAAARAARPRPARRASSATTRRWRVFPRIYDRVRRRQPGFVSRSKDWWELRKLDDRPERRRGAGELNRVLLEIDGQPVRLRALPDQGRVRGGAVNKSQVQVLEAIGDSPVAVRELWRYLLAIDWVGRDRLRRSARRPPALPARAAAEPPRLEGLRRPLAAARRRRRRALRPVDRRATAASRSTSRPTRSSPTTSAPGRWPTASPRRSQRRADVRLDVQALACAYLGGFTFAELARAGRVEEVARGGIARADALYRVERKPWCPEIF